MAIQAGRDPNTSHSATKPHRMRIEIVQMGKHFLYLPLYYAELRNFFGYISEKYEINIITARPATDVQAYRMLMRGDPDNNRLPAHFAILDPTQMLNPDFVIPAGEAPALLGGIVTNAAFWAVDSGTRRLVRISDLAQFSQIIAFNRGTTSFAIAHRIYTDAGKTPSILTVESGQELRALEHQKVDTIALSPDILEADIVEAESKRYQIDMILGTTPEYNNVLVTGLLSRRSVVNQHRDLSVGLLKAINHAAALVRNGDDGVVEFAYRYFRVQSTERVRSALARANDAYVFPFNIEVVDGQWVNAARAYYHSMLPDGAGKEAAREMHEQRARDALEQWIVPYRHLARKAITEVMKPLSEPSDAEIRQERPFLRRILEKAPPVGSGDTMG